MMGMTAGSPRRWLHRMRIRLGVPARLYTVALLLLAALAVQSGSSLYSAGTLREAAGRLAHDSFDSITHARRIHELVSSERRTIAAAASGVEATALAAFRDCITELRA